METHEVQVSSVTQFDSFACRRSLYLTQRFDNSYQLLENNGEQLELLKKAAIDAIHKNIWTEENLKEEREANSESWKAHAHLNAAVARVEDGLVERGEDARLVVLAMIANEHILLLGKPGTGKYEFHIFHFRKETLQCYYVTTV